MKKLIALLHTTLLVFTILTAAGCSDSEEKEAPPTSIILFSTAEKYNANLGGRNGADEKCRNSSNTPNNKKHIHAFISVSVSDCIANMPTTYNFPANIPILARDGITVIATNWADLLDGKMNPTLDAAGVLVGGHTSSWWSGSKADGTLDDTHCDGWTSNSGWGTVGEPDKADSWWIDCGESAGHLEYHLLGIAY